MITLIALHWMGPDKKERGLNAFRHNSSRATKAKGFISRLALESTTDSELWTTVTTWETMDDYNNFQNDPNKPKSDPNNPHFDKLERDVYEVNNTLTTMPNNTEGTSNKAVALVALHWMGKEKFDRGMEAFKKNTADSKNANGLISRMALKSTTDPELWATVTVWESIDHYNDFQNLPDRPKNNNATPLFDKVERDVYSVDTDLSLNWTG